MRRRERKGRESKRKGKKMREYRERGGGESILGDKEGNGNNFSIKYVLKLE